MLDAVAYGVETNIPIFTWYPAKAVVEMLQLRNTQRINISVRDDGAGGADKVPIGGTTHIGRGSRSKVQS